MVLHRSSRFEDTRVTLTVLRVPQGCIQWCLGEYVIQGLNLVGQMLGLYPDHSAISCPFMLYCWKQGTARVCLIVFLLTKRGQKARDFLSPKFWCLECRKFRDLAEFLSGVRPGMIRASEFLFLQFCVSVVCLREADTRLGRKGK